MQFSISSSNHTEKITADTDSEDEHLDILRLDIGSAYITDEHIVRKLRFQERGMRWVFQSSGILHNI